MSQLTAATKQFYKDVQGLMRANGYEYCRRVHSANEELRFIKNGYPTITLDGWHGTGKGSRCYGTVKVCHGLYVGIDQVLTAMDVNLDEMYPTAYDVYVERLQTMMNYIAKNIPL